MSDADERLAELRSALAERDAKIARLVAELAEHDVEVARLGAEVKRLTEVAAALDERLGQDSTNSSKPPSSDTPASRNKRKQARRGRKARRRRGGQQGHQGHRRELLPESEVGEIVDLYPEACENCWEPLPRVPDRCATRHQVTELPPVKPDTTEYRRRKLATLLARPQAGLPGLSPCVYGSGR